MGQLAFHDLPSCKTGRGAPAMDGAPVAIFDGRTDGGCTVVVKAKSAWAMRVMLRRYCYRLSGSLSDESMTPPHTARATPSHSRDDSRSERNMDARITVTAG